MMLISFVRINDDENQKVPTWWVNRTTIRRFPAITEWGLTSNDCQRPHQWNKLFTANNDSVADFHLSALIHPTTAWAQIAWLFLKLGQENTDISLTVDVINDLHISAQVQVQQSTLKSYIYYYVPKVQLIRISILFYISFVFCRM